MNYVFQDAKTRWIILWSVLAFIGVSIVLMIIRIPLEYRPIITSFVALYLIPLLWFRAKLQDEDYQLKDLFRKSESSFSAKNYSSAIVFMTLYSLGAITIVTAILWQFLSESTRSFILEINEVELTLMILLLNLVITIVVAPIFEEIIFRGFLFGRMSYKFGVTKGVIISSVLFGLLHGPNFIGATLTGIILCLIFIKTGSLIIPVILHMIYNIFAYATEIVQVNLGFGVHLLEELNFTTLVLIGAILLTIGLFWFIYFSRNNWSYVRANQFPID
ncbi:CPBP family intramembrane glutamic endopeptidase [Alkalibacillus haloalkaliphilus]|uniref:AbrB family transcriptional regulator n=1 Tax=Alkalibacillus haloalkaliphilus TaxID=94136 RepID=A0A511W802_9BACI|nr:type II CAAX endopeptidase family protein [Alkalibacillus haloalkaliphilus]GEN46183.1 AbrB family transcriptional regulator [Alkalibacillus haloalkaliphilus]